MTELCAALAVSRSAYYDWKKAEPNLYRRQDGILAPMIQDIFCQHRRRYGARRIAHELQSRDIACSRGKVRKIMAQRGLVAIQPKSFKPRTTNSRHKLGYSPNLLLGGIAVTRINQVWVADITYVSLANRFAYLALLMDLYSRKIVGWCLAPNMEAALVIRALKQAIKNRQPQAGLIHHTDRGGQYAAGEYRALLARASMQQSMSRAADCYDNAFMESCFGTIKTELEMSAYETFSAAFQEIEEYINYYNNLRRHSAIEYSTPTHFEQNHKA